MEVPERCPYCGGVMYNGYEWINSEVCICYKCYENLSLQEE